MAKTNGAPFANHSNGFGEGPKPYFRVIGLRCRLGEPTSGLDRSLLITRIVKRCRGLHGERSCIQAFFSSLVAPRCAVAFRWIRCINFRFEESHRRPIPRQAG